MSIRIDLTNPNLKDVNGDSCPLDIKNLINASGIVAITMFRDSFTWENVRRDIARIIDINLLGVSNLDELEEKIKQNNPAEEVVSPQEKWNKFSLLDFEE